MKKSINSPVSPTKRELIPDDFLSRAEKLKKKKIPSTTEFVIIVRSNNEGLGFRFDCYPANLLNNVISKEKFDYTVKEAHKICENAWTEKKKQENANFNPFVNNLDFIAKLFTFIGLLLLVIYMYSDSGFAIFPISFIFIGIACVIMVIVALISIFSEPKFMGLDKTIKGKLQLFLKEENKKVYYPIGYEWRMEKCFYWLELVNLRHVGVVQEGNEVKLNFKN